MEDGDDDTSLTADGQQKKREYQLSENHAVMTKNDGNETLYKDVYPVSPISGREDISCVAPTPFEDKGASSDQESENKTFSADVKRIHNPAEFLDEDSSVKIHNPGASSSVPMPNESIVSEENDSSALQENITEQYEDQREQLCSGEGNAFSSMEEAENIHSSLDEEEKSLVKKEEDEEEEEEEEEANETSTSSGEVASKFSENYLVGTNIQHRDDTIGGYEGENKTSIDQPSEECKSVHLNEEYEEKSDPLEEFEEECDTPIDRSESASEFLNNSDLQNETSEDECKFPEKHVSVEESDKLFENDSKFQEERDSVEEMDKFEPQNENNYNTESQQHISDHFVLNDKSRDESSSEKDSVLTDIRDSDRNFHDEVLDNSDTFKEKEERSENFFETSSPQQISVSKENFMSESEEVDMEIDFKKDSGNVIEQLNILQHHSSIEDEQESQFQVNQGVDDHDSSEADTEQNSLQNSADLVVNESNTGEVLESEKMITESEEWNEIPEKQEIEKSSPKNKEEEMSFDNVINSGEIKTKIKETEEEKLSDMNDVEVVSQKMEGKMEVHEAATEESADATVCKMVSSSLSSGQECSNMNPDEFEENEDYEKTISTNEPRNANIASETESDIKINGEVELTNNNLLSEEETTISVKEKAGLKRKLQTSPSQEISSDNSPPDTVRGNVQYKGFKKRYIAQVSEICLKESPDTSTSVQEEPRVKSKRSAKKLILETPQVLVSHQPLPDGAQANTPLTEYAQYLGLQPTVKFKCYNCGESGFPSMLKLQEHQNVCLKNIRIHTYSKPPPSPIVEPAPSTNFRITRKVYLCSACGTYYENWNLFLHMREVHKRHICLFCLLMFSQADKLAQHLSAKHGIVDNSYNSPDQFLNEFKGSFFVMCCTCEQMFSERDNFFDHMCKDNSVITADQACSLCGLKGAHFPTCRRAFTDSSSSQNNLQSAAINASSDSPQNSQLGVQDKSTSASKYSMQSDKLLTGRKSLHKLPEQSLDHPDKSHNSGDLDDDYDISDAASYCHVNIHEPDKQKAGSLDGKVINNEETNKENNRIPEKNDKVQNTEEIQSSISVSKEIAKDDSADDVMEKTNETNDFVSQTGTLMPQSTEITEKRMSVEEKSETFPPLSNVDDAKETDNNVGIPSYQSKSPKEVDSESDSSASGVDSHDSDVSSSSSDASSEENDLEEKEPQRTLKSEDSDVDKSDSDKMSIVVDEAKSEEDIGKLVTVNESANNSVVTENDISDINEQKNDSAEELIFKVVDKSSTNADVGEDQPDNIQIAGDDVPLLELTLEETLDALSIQTVVKECVKISCGTCVYCNHAKKIAVNGKQLVLHLLAEHRFEPVVCSDSGELTPIFGFVDNLKAKLSELQDMYFNTDTYDSADKSFTRPYDRTYECFHCHFITTLHKELYVHNRKMHQKTILLCIMCKSNFYSYSELLCHLCPGIYVPDSNILFRCCLCVVDGLPSAFRLMVHLRKRHHACDVCLETTGDQQKLSNHVWKHKLHHLCYRCGIAYRNKPDITKHLFWKHGTESVLCKKCLQKKWPHVYHFCIPPTAFLCEECNASFSRAVALKVHKRLHSGDIPYQCDECNEKFISKKLLRRHKEKHKQVVEKDDHKNDQISVNEVQEQEQLDESLTVIERDDSHKDVEKEDCAVEKCAAAANDTRVIEDPKEVCKEPTEVNSDKLSEEIKDSKKTKVVDVYDLPPLNLSSDSDDSDEEQANKQSSNDIEDKDNSKTVTNENPCEVLKSQEGEPSNEDDVLPVQVVDGVWDNFKTYKANLEKREILQAQVSGSLVASSTSHDDNAENHAIVDVVMADHDYCVLPEKLNEEMNPQLTVDSPHLSTEQHISAELNTEPSENLDEKSGGFGADHNYCFNTSPQSEEKKDVSTSLPEHLNIPSLQSPPHPIPHQSLTSSPPPAQTPNISQSVSPKKKQRSPKKRQKQSGSSSSSDSSSNSDSSSCTCGTNCSCSSSSSSSSGSSSTSSDSDSSSSEGRRRQAARRERRRERAKRKTETGSRGGTPPPEMRMTTPVTEGSVIDGGGGGDIATNLETTSTPAQIDLSGTGSLQVDDMPIASVPEREENEFLIRESDLDTTETETDEDFYDKYPQKQANKLLAEKRNQLLLLAAVAPVNNGKLAQPSPPPPPEVQEPIQNKKKGKTKRHKKAQHNSCEKKVESKLKLNIPVAYYNSPLFSVSSAGRPASPLTNSQNPSSSHISRLPHDTFSSSNPDNLSTPSAYHSTGSGSETESKRLSKRKRIPKKFYGDSSDEEAEQTTPHQPYKWRKVTPGSSNTPQTQPTITSGFGYRAVSCNLPLPEPIHIQPLPPQDKSDDEDGDESDSGHEEKRSSSDSSNSDSDNEQSDADSDVETVATVTNTVSSVSGNIAQQKNENLYCYCQCPYDEVSEMIACDGKDCSIEWFHFECVGIMVPPKGKWFCPDCRKKTAARSEYLLHA